MHDGPEVAVLRLGHRPGRDDRMTTHIGLTARALGADRAILVGETSTATGTIRDITDRFGGPFAVEIVESHGPTVREWDGTIIHLTMYGERVQDVENEIRETHVEADEPVLVVVGAEKVPFDVYESADYNVGVTNQPHSEVAALAVFLDRLFAGRELDREWVDAEKTVVPMETGKRVVESDESGEVGNGHD